MLLYSIFYINLPFKGLYKHLCVYLGVYAVYTWIYRRSTYGSLLLTPLNNKSLQYIVIYLVLESTVAIPYYIRNIIFFNQ